MTLAVLPVSASVARAVAEAEHYMHRKPQVSWAFGLQDGPALRGICTFGPPASREVQKGACPGDPSKVTEFNRLWVHDDMPRNTESWFVAQCLRELPAMIVVSYADTAAGHLGYVYRAMNFRYAGWTDMERRTPRYDYMPHVPGTHTRDAYRNGWSHRVPRRPKVKYWTVTGDRAERRALEKLCGWPSLDWKALPPPVEHRQHRILRNLDIPGGNPYIAPRPYGQRFPSS